MSAFSLDELVGMAEHSKWEPLAVSSEGYIEDEGYLGKLRLENNGKVWLDISKYHEEGQETYRLVVFKYNQYYEVVYGDNAARVLEIARGKARGNSRYMKGLAKESRKSMELLKKHRERYGK